MSQYDIYGYNITRGLTYAEKAIRSVQDILSISDSEEILQSVETILEEAKQNLVTVQTNVRTLRIQRKNSK